MKNRFASLSFVSLLFFGTIVLKAQDSKEILDLKKKLSLTQTDDEKVKIYGDLGNLYSDAKNIDSAIHYSQISLPIYKKNKDVEQIGRANLFIGNMYLTRNDLDEGLKYLLEAEKYLHKTQNYEKRAMLNLLMARINTVYKKNDASAKYFEEILKYYHDKRAFDKRFVMYSYQGLYINYFVQQDFVKGFASLKTYIDFVEKYYPESLYLAYKDAGTFFLTSRDNKKSLYYFQKAYEIAKKNKDQAQIADSGVSLSMVYGETNQLDVAKKHLNVSKDYYESQDNKAGLASVYYYLSDTYSKEKDYVRAQEYAAKCLKMSSESDPLFPYYKNHKGNIELKQIMEDSLGLKNSQSKLSELSKLAVEQRKSLNHFTEMNTVVSPELFIQNYEVLHRAYAFLGDYPQSYSYLKKMHDKKEETYGLNKMKEFSSLQSETEVANERAKVKLEEETKRIQLQKEIELKALRFEYEKKQAAAKTEEERKRLALAEDLKRKEIQIKFNEEQKAIALKYSQEKNIAKINQEKKDAIAKAELESSQNQKNIWAVGAGLSLLLLGFAGYSYNQKRKDNKKIAEEKKKSDDLLLNILPFEIAEELKEKGKTSAKHFDEVSVLFTDFVNFTANSERIGVQEVLNELNICFTEFDRIMEKYGLEKIKTIGDAYLAVSGLPVSNQKHAENAVNAGLEILSYIQQRKKNTPNTLDIRIGIHSGPVIAGIVGVKKFAYDIWGDTVNTAARMEQNSVLGKLNVSEATYQLVKDHFTFEHRGKIETKGKGAMEMYFVNQVSS